ncbi:hypothetical protein ABIB57_003155 [Devosia sp. UYZn731]
MGREYGANMVRRQEDFIDFKSFNTIALGSCQRLFPNSSDP